MKPRQVAALALVEWFLMCPPFSATSISDNAPLSAWKMNARYPTEEVCDKQRAGAETTMNAWPANDPVLHSAATIMHHRQCLDSDDPRLKGK